VLQKGDNNKPPFWRSNRVLNNTQFSSYHLSEKTLPYYVNKIVELKPVFIDSYPSSIYTVANYLEKTGNPGIFPKFIITSSETLLEHQRNLIEKVFKCAE
jgi:phenylacetate-CoA ligase